MFNSAINKMAVFCVGCLGIDLGKAASIECCVINEVIAITYSVEIAVNELDVLRNLAVIECEIIKGAVDKGAAINSTLMEVNVTHVLVLKGLSRDIAFCHILSLCVRRVCSSLGTRVVMGCFCRCTHRYRVVSANFS